MGRELTKAEVHERLARAGCPLNDEQLTRRLRLGMAPRPRQEHRRGVRGSVSLYPEEVVEHLVAAERLPNRPRSLEQVAVRLWWDDMHADQAVIRDLLVAELDRVSAEARNLLHQHGDAFAVAEAVAAELPDPERLPAPYKLMLSRLGGNREDLASVIHTLAMLAFGGTPAWDREEFQSEDARLTDLMDRAVGIARAKADPMPSGSAWIEGEHDVRETLLELQRAGAFDICDLGGIVRNASADELERARADARMLAEALTVIARAVEAMFGRDHAGLATFRLFLEAEGSVRSRALLVRSCIALRRVAPEGAFDEVAAAVRLVEPVAELYLAVYRALPRFRRMLKAGREGAVALLPSGARTTVARTANALLEANPRWARALASLESR